jgi:hypothetical protein
MTAAANEQKMDQSNENRQICAGMYSRASWGGAVDPHILVKFIKNTAADDTDPIASLVIFEWKDYDYIGVFPTADSVMKEYICDTEMINNNFCSSNQTGEFIFAPNATELSKNLLFTQAIHLKDPGNPINYGIKKTGYFCVGTTGFSPTDAQYTALVEFRNAYGELPAAQVAKLPFYGGITIVYAVIGAFWAFLYVQHRHDILPVQNYITAIIIFLVIEMLATWGFYGIPEALFGLLLLILLDYMNRNGSNVGSKVLMIFVAILNAGRNSFSFFLLLIVCMGYGVVKPSLGKTMIYVRWLAGAHFVFGLIYSIASLTITPESAGKLFSPFFPHSLIPNHRPSRPLRHPTPSRHPNRFLRLDTQLPKHDNERSHRTQANRQSPHVPQTLVGHPRIHHRNLWLLLLQFLHLRLNLRP